MAICRLGDLIKIKHGYAFKGNYISTEDNGIVLVTPGNFKIGGGFKEEKCKFFASVYPSDYVLKPGDLIVTMTDLSKTVDTLGYSAIVPNSKRTYLHNQRIGLINIINSTIVDKKYLYWLMRSPKYQKTIAATSTGSTVHHTSPNRIYEYEFDLPQISVQRKIAGILSDIEEKINKNSAINNNLFEQMQALYKAWFVDFEPFGGVRPSNWNDTNIYAIANIIYGAPFASKLFNTNGLGKPIIRIRDLKEQAFVTFTTEEHPKGHLIQPGDIVVGMDGEFRPYIWGNEPAWLNQRVCIFESNRPQGKAFVLYTIKPLLNKIEQTQVATTVIHIGKKDFDAFEIIIPDEATLDSFDSITAPMIEQIVNNRLQNKRLAVLRDTLLPKLMSGELDV